MSDLNFTDLKLAVGSMLSTNHVKPKSVAGQKMIHAFWLGAIAQSGQPTPPGVAILMLTGQYEKLVKMESTK